MQRPRLCAGKRPSGAGRPVENAGRPPHDQEGLSGALGPAAGKYGRLFSENDIMSDLPVDPFAAGGLEAFAAEFRAGRVTSEAVTRAYLERIEKLEGRPVAFESDAADSATATARARDALIKTGADLGPLMGVPIAIKDVFVISGMPAPRVGSNLELPG